MGRPAGSKNKPKDDAPAAEPVKAVKQIVEPTVKFVGDSKKHALQLLFEGEDVPVIKSVGTVGVPNTNTWISFVLHSQGDKVIKIEAEEPNLRAIAEESAKISFVDTFMSVE